MTLPTNYTSPTVVADMTAAAAAAGGNDYKALVCVFLFGANDTHNTVIPLTGANRAAYDTYRSNQVNVGIPIAQAPANGLTANWRLHHNLTSLKSRWDAGKLAVLMNAGMLQEPITRAEYLAGTKKLPEQLFSHNSQTQQWQSLPVYKGQMLEGWFGRAVDLAGAYYNPAPYNGLPPGFSVAGQQLQLLGYEAKANDMLTTGALVVGVGTPNGSNMTTSGHLIAARSRNEYDNILQGLWSQRMLSAIASQASLSAQLQALPATPEGRFTAVPNNSLAQQLKTVARAIHSRTQFVQRRQVFFVGIGGFDHHATLRAQHDPLMAGVNQALDVFWNVLGDLGVQNNVTTFTQSEFGRALIQNGSHGVDHGWGSHHFVLGGAVNGGLYGIEPNITPNGPDDAGQGRLVPTTSVDQYAATLLRWWGIPEQYLPLVIPNLEKFAPRVLPGMLP